MFKILYFYQNGISFFSGFGCTGNAFGYSSMHTHRRSCADLDNYNPNIFPDTSNIKDNRIQSVFGDTEKNVNNKELIKSPGK